MFPFDLQSLSTKKGWNCLSARFLSLSISMFIIQHRGLGPGPGPGPLKAFKTITKAEQTNFTVIISHFVVP